MATPKPQIHIFERAGLGKAPYRYLGCEKQHTGCQYCGTAIAFKFWLQAADGKRFFVGSDCILKSGDAGLRNVIEPELRKHRKEMADERNKATIAEFETELAKRPTFYATTYGMQPHPSRYYASQGKTMADYVIFCYEHSGPSSKATWARRFLRDMGLRTAKKPRKQTKPTPAPKSTGIASTQNPGQTGRYSWLCPTCRTVIAVAVNSPSITHCVCPKCQTDFDASGRIVPKPEPPKPEPATDPKGRKRFKKIIL